MATDPLIKKPGDTTTKDPLIKTPADTTLQTAIYDKTTGKLTGYKNNQTGVVTSADGSSPAPTPPPDTSGGPLPRVAPSSPGPNFGSADKTFKDVQETSFEDLLKESKGSLDSINKTAEDTLAQKRASMAGALAGAGLGGSTAGYSAELGQEQPVLQKRQDDTNALLQTIRDNATTLASTEITNDRQLKENAKADATDFIKQLATSHTDLNKFKAENPQDYQHLVDMLGSSNYVDAMFASNIPKENILNTTITGSTAMVISQDPVTGKTSAHSYDLGISVPKGWIQEKIGTNSVIYHDTNWNPTDPSTYQIFAIDPLTGLPTTQVAGNENPVVTEQKTTVSDLSTAISKLESGGSYNAVGPTLASGTYKGEQALGKYQIVPGAWFSTLGLDPTSDIDKQNFLNDPSAQESAFATIMGSLVRQYGGDKNKAIAAYFGGDAGAKAYGTPAGDKITDGNMSINDYVKKVASSLPVAGADDYVYGNFVKGLTPQGQKAFNSLSDTNKSNIKQLVSGEVLLSDLVRSRGVQGTAQLESLTKMAQQVDPTFSVNTNKIRYGFLQKWNDPNSALGKTRNSINTALGHLADVKEMTTALTPDDLQFVNSTKNWWSVESGSPEITSLQFGLGQLATEIATVYKGAAPSDEEIQQEKAVLGTQLSSAQFNGLLNTVSQFLSSKITSSRYQYKSTMGQEYDQPIIDPDKKQALIDAGIDPTSIAKEDTGGVQDVQTLAKDKGFDYAGAIAAGYSDADIQAYLNQ